MNLYKICIVLLFCISCSRQQQQSTSGANSTKVKSNSRINVSFRYHNYEELTKLLKLIAKRFPGLAKLYSIGKSVEGRELWVMHLTDNRQDEVALKPNVKYVANMHGNEAVGRELMLHLVAHLVNNANKSTNVRNLLRHTNIHVMPSMNPDGFEKSIEGKCEGPGRRNAANVDLNRNFPDRLASPNEESTAVEQPETRAVRQWIANTQFVLSANLHSGSLVVNLPFDNSRNESDHVERTPDHDVFLHLALAYAKKHPKLSNKPQCKGEQVFEKGITNGNAWYPIKGSMQDYNYVAAGCMELTLELSCCKHPDAAKESLHSFWSDNKIALLTFLTEAHKGVKGVVRDSYTDLVIGKANLTILGRDMAFQTDGKGQFWRILLPGDYVLVVKARGYKTLQKQFTVTESKITVINVYMAPLRRSRTLSEGWHNKGDSRAIMARTESLTLTNAAPGGIHMDSSVASLFLTLSALLLVGLTLP